MHPEDRRGIERRRVERIARIHRGQHVLEPVLADGELRSERGHAHGRAARPEEPHVKLRDDDVPKSRSHEAVRFVVLFEWRVRIVTPEIFAVESVVPLCPKAGTVSATPAERPIRIANRFIDLASRFGVRQLDGCVPGYPDRDRLGKCR